MAVLHVLTEPDPRLRKISKPVESITLELFRFIDDMVDTMRAEEGCGLAAPQVNLQRRIIVVEYQIETSTDDNPEYILYKMINPEIMERSEEYICNKEGCLSVPGERVDVERHERITVRYLNEYGEEKTLHATGLPSIIIQHEIDHLDGKLIVDYLSPLKKDVVLKRLKKRTS